jgi:hypothetical protein
MNVKTIAPQSGFQEKFLSTSADIAIGGGAAGAGKTICLLLEPLRHKDNPQFSSIIFRRTYPQITNPGGLWDSSANLYHYLDARPNQSDMNWRFPSGAAVKFSHIQHEKNIYDFQGSEIPYIGFDELNHFTDKMFWYLVSRNRSLCGVKPYIRATCNPDPESWVSRLIEWYIDKDTGYPIEERSGVIRYFTRDNGELVWGNTKQEVIDRCPHIFDAVPVDDKDTLVKSFTFIPGSIYENVELMKKDPQYLANLLALDEAEKAQLLGGNWKIQLGKESMINYSAILDCFTSEYVPSGKRYITADIAFHGSDNFVLYVWEGWRIVDIEVLGKVDASDVENKIKEMAKKYSVMQSAICYDADGIGAFLKGYLRSSYGFNNGGSPIEERLIKVNYENLKTQCYYKLAEKINKGEIFITKNVAERKINSKFVRDIIIEESKAIKKHKTDADGKLKIIPKSEMKNILGRSPDFMDAMMMRVIFDLKPVSFSAPKATVISMR